MVKIRIRSVGTALTAPLAAFLVAVLASVVLAGAPAGASSSGDVAAAEAGTVQQADVPSGFTESSAMQSQAGPPPDSASSSANDSLSKEVRKIPECKAFVTVFQPTSKSVTASADGASFDKSQALGGAQLSSSTLIFTSANAAKKFFVPIKAAKLPTCLDKAMKTSIKQSMSQGSAAGMFSKFSSSTSKLPVPKLGDETVAYRITFDIGTDKSSGASISLKMYMDMEFVRTGRGLGAYMSLSTGTPGTTTAQPAIKAAVGRMRQALA